MAGKYHNGSLKSLPIIDIEIICGFAEKISAFDNVQLWKEIDANN
jgi:hypothetical protein